MQELLDQNDVKTIVFIDLRGKELSEAVRPNVFQPQIVRDGLQLNTTKANRVVRIYGGSPVLNIYEIADSFMDTDELKIKDFGEETSPEWARFVRNNRSKKFKDYSMFTVFKKK